MEASLETGRLIARAREDAGLEQTDLAQRLGWSVRTLSNLENGRRPVYTDGELATLAGHLGVPAQSLRRGAPPARTEGLSFQALLAGLTREQLQQVVREARAELRARAR